MKAQARGHYSNFVNWNTQEVNRELTSFTWHYAIKGKTIDIQTENIHFYDQNKKGLSRVIWVILIMNIPHILYKNNIWFKQVELAWQGTPGFNSRHSSPKVYNHRQNYMYIYFAIKAHTSITSSVASLTNDSSERTRSKHFANWFVPSAV